ncbi:hypothetical protein [Symmachiella macrocystis]|nr:hypothetical protein [Symmachiella macrocystis]
MTLAAASYVLAQLPTAQTSAAEASFSPAATIKCAVETLEEAHISRQPLNDELSSKWFQAYFDWLDPRRMYFLQADLAEFRHFEKSLDDAAKQGRFEFPKLVRQRYRRRVKQAATWAEEFLAREQEFTNHEELPLGDPGFATDDNQLRERWRLRIKGELLIEKLHGVPLQEVTDRLRSRYRRIAQQAKDMTDERLCNIYLNALTASYDPRSSYLSPDTVRMFSESVSRYHYSLGMTLERRRGRYLIGSILVPVSNPLLMKQIVGWELTAIRTADGETIDLVELPSDDLIGMTLWADGPLGGNAVVILELLHPVTLERQSLVWPRFES